MNKYLIDTDILIDFLRGNEHSQKYLADLADSYTLLCSVMTVAEIHAGMRKSEEVKTDAFLKSLYIIPVSEKIAEIAGKFKRETKTHRLELDDCIIAATAFSENAVLSTKNIKHFPIKSVKVKSPDYI